MIHLDTRRTAGQTSHHTAATMQRATSGAHVQFGSKQKKNSLYHPRSGYNAIYNHLVLGLCPGSVIINAFISLTGFGITYT